MPAPADPAGPRIGESGQLGVSDTGEIAPRGEAAAPPVVRPDQSPAEPGAEPPVTSVPIGRPDGVRIELELGGRGLPPRDPSMPVVVRRQAAAQAAIFAGIYNVTKQINPEQQRDPIEAGTVTSDHYRYDGGLIVKSRIEVTEGVVREFDMWLIVGDGEAGGGDELRVHVVDFRLRGQPLDGRQMRRIFKASGGRLFVLSLDGPGRADSYRADIGLAGETE